jgi:late control gene D protein (GPD)
MPDQPPLAQPQLRFHGPGAPTSAVVLSLRGEEALDSLYRLEIEFLCPAEGFDPDALLYARAALGVPSAGAVRWVAGSVGQLQLSEGPAGSLKCKAVIQPRLSALGRRRRSRILRDLSLVGLIRTLLGELGLSEGEDFAFGPELLESESKRPFGTRAERPRYKLIVQENETDLAFLTRWLEREGVGLSFASDESGREQVLFFDGELPCGEVELPVEEQRHLETTRSPLPRGVVVISDGQLEEPLNAAAACDPRGGPEEILPDAHWRNVRQARHLAELRRQELVGQATRYRASSSDGRVRPGLWIRSGEHRLRVLGVRYDYTRAGGAKASFGLEWVAESAAVPHRPVRVTPWPVNANTAAALAALAPESAAKVAEAAAAKAPSFATTSAPQPAASLAEPAQPATSSVETSAPAPELVGALPSPGFGSPVEGDDGYSSNDDTDGDGNTDTRGVDDLEDPFDISAELWNAWLDDYYSAQTEPSWRPHWHREHKATLIPRMQMILPPGQPWNMFERECTSFSGSFGGAYGVSIGAKAFINLGNSSTENEGIYCGSKDTWVTQRSLSNVGLTDSISNVGASMSLSNALTTNDVSNTGAANSMSNTLMSNSVSNTLMSNSMTATLMSNSMSKTMMENSKTDVAMSNSMSMVGMSNSMSTVGMSTEMNTVAIANSMTMGAMSNSISMVAMEMSMAMGDQMSMNMGSELSMSMGPTTTSLSLVGQATNLNLCSTLDLLLGSSIGMTIGSGMSMTLGSDLGMVIGLATSINLGTNESIGVSSTDVELKDSKIGLLLGIGS